MKFLRNTVLAASIVLAAGFASSLNAQDLAFDYIGAAGYSVSPAVTFPGVALGQVGFGTPVTGFVPCFGASCKPAVKTGILEVNTPIILAAAGASGQLYFTAQTTTFSGNATVTVDVVQAKKSTKLLSGTLPLAANTLYVIYGTAPSKLPTTLVSGPASIVATLTEGTVKSRVSTAIFIQ